MKIVGALRRGTVHAAAEKNDGFLAGDAAKTIENREQAARKIQVGKAHVKIQIAEGEASGGFVLAQFELHGGRGGVADDGDAIVCGEIANERVGFLCVLRTEEIHGGATFEHEEDLGGIVVGEESRDGLLDAVIENVEVRFLEAFDEFAAAIGGDDADVDAADFDANRGSLWFLCEKKRGKNEKQKKGSLPQEEATGILCEIHSVNQA